MSGSIDHNIYEKPNLIRKLTLRVIFQRNRIHSFCIMCPANFFKEKYDPEKMAAFTCSKSVIETPEH